MIDFTTNFWQHKTALIDSRKLLSPKQSIFFAIKGQLTDGHEFIPALYQQGVRCFVVTKSEFQKSYPDASFVVVENPIETLQEYARFHRLQFDIPVIGITGSNGKTILKEWLFLLLEQDFALIKSPKSYNSQIGVPLSVLEMNERHELAIFEAGISQIDEMQKLQKIIQPTIGVFTNIGKAHANGFESQEQKIREKLKLFKDCKTLIYRIEHQKIHQEILQWKEHPSLWSWGASTEATIPIYTQTKTNFTLVEIHWQGTLYFLEIPFTNAAAIENCLHGVATLLYLNIPIQELSQRIEKLRDIPMRLELKEGVNGCHIIDDSYNNDFEGLKIALDFLNQKHKNNPAYTKTLILSDIPDAQVKSYAEIAQLIAGHHIQKIIGIGQNLYQNQTLFDKIPERYFFRKTSDFVQVIDESIFFNQESILLKGARAFEFERIAQQLKKRLHGTVLEINLSAITNNLQVYKNLLKPSTKMMVMVKASAYGSSSYEIAQLLQYNHIDYLGVAYVDEGIALRKHGIQLPIMIMNVAAYEFELLCHYELEPVIYSFKILEEFQEFLKLKTDKKNYPVHIEIDTGMHRLGFLTTEISKLIEQLKLNDNQIFIKGIFSHLAASDENEYEDFTKQQIAIFKQISEELEQALNVKSIQHILNSAGISRFPEQQLDMVRLGIGLYGIDPNKRLKLQNVLTLKTTIAQIKVLENTETVGYSRKGKIVTTSQIAVLSIGYADGFLRVFGNGRAAVKLRGQLAPTIGNICMDMCFIDISHIPEAQEGDEVVIFDSIESIEKLANSMNTISYEILTNISDRVPRVFFEE